MDQVGAKLVEYNYQVADLRGTNTNLPTHVRIQVTGLDRVVPLLEGVGDVLEEDQPERDVLVLARVHVPAHLVRCGSELLLEPEIRTVARAGPLRPLLLLASHVDGPRCP